jgi:hypothetical protein
LPAFASTSCPGAVLRFKAEVLMMGFLLIVKERNGVGFRGISSLAFGIWERNCYSFKMTKIFSYIFEVAQF